jgi:hypothetical protein
MKLTITDRIQLPALFPSKGNLIEVQLIEDIRKKVLIDQEVMKEIDFVGTPSGDGKISYTWKKEKETDLEVTFTKLELDLLKKCVKELDERKEVDVSMLELCQKINNEKHENA